MNIQASDAIIARSERRSGGTLRHALMTLAGAIALLWPAYLNGGPFWFPDSSNYVRAADAAVVYITGAPSEWSDRLKINNATASEDTGSLADGAAAVSAQPAPVQPTRPVLAGRSIYYGFLLYLPMRFFGPWGSIFLQALLVAGILCYVGLRIQRIFQLSTRTPVLWLVPVLLLASPLPFYTSMLMPDVYTGLLVLMLATLLCLWPHLLKGERIALGLLCATAATFHTTHLLITGGVGIAALIFARERFARWRAVTVSVAVIATGAASALAFNLGVAQALGQAPVSPPFLSARITDAGPGTDYLRERCGRDGVDFVLCRYLERLPAHSDAFLWDPNPQTAVYQILTDEERTRISMEDKRFFLAVMAYDPVAFVMACLRAFGAQLVDFDMEGFNPTASEVAELEEKYPLSVAQAIRGTMAASSAFPLTPVTWLTIATTIAALAVLAFAWMRSRRDQTPDSAMVWSWAAIIILGLLANAAVCGALSGPHGRYQMRVIWLLPLVAVTVATARGVTPVRESARMDGLAGR